MFEICKIQVKHIFGSQELSVPFRPYTLPSARHPFVSIRTESPFWKLHAERKNKAVPADCGLKYCEKRITDSCAQLKHKGLR